MAEVIHKFEDPNTKEIIQVEQPEDMIDDDFFTSVKDFFSQASEATAQGGDAFSEAGKAIGKSVDALQPHAQEWFKGVQENPKEAASALTELFTGLDMNNLEQYKDLPLSALVGMAVLNKGGGKVKAANSNLTNKVIKGVAKDHPNTQFNPTTLMSVEKRAEVDKVLAEINRILER